MKFINYSEAKSEAERLSRNLKRDVEVASVNCNCDYDRTCGTCGGQGYVFQLRYGFCDHVLQDDNDDECISADCQHLEYKAFCEREEEMELTR